MPDLVRQCELTDFWWYSTVVVDECYNTGIERTFGTLVHAPNGFGVSLVFLTYATRGATGAGNPCQTCKI